MTEAAEMTIIPHAHAELPAPFRARHLIGGAWTDSVDGEVSERRSPSHGDLVSIAAKGGAPEVDAGIAAAREAFDAGDWAFSSGAYRAGILLRVADLIEKTWTVSL